jgi:hypothetical protein
MSTPYRPGRSYQTKEQANKSALQEQQIQKMLGGFTQNYLPTAQSRVAPAKPSEALGGLLSLIPGVGDTIGAVADAKMYYDRPEERTLKNGLLSVAGLLPMVAGASAGATAKRMASAKEMGMRTGMPLYHGTNKDFHAFDLSRGGDVSGSPVGALGVSLAIDPETAGEFARLAGDEGANIMKVFHRADKPATIRLEGNETNLEIAGAVKDAWDAGYDSLKFTNYTTPGGKKGQQFILVRSPNQVRSVNAQFDPKNKDSSNLLAGVGAAAVGLAVAKGKEKSENNKQRKNE